MIEHIKVARMILNHYCNILGQKGQGARIGKEIRKTKSIVLWHIRATGINGGLRKSIWATCTFISVDVSKFRLTSSKFRHNKSKFRHNTSKFRLYNSKFRLNISWNLRLKKSGSFHISAQNISKFRQKISKFWIVMPKFRLNSKFLLSYSKFRVNTSKFWLIISDFDIRSRNFDLFCRYFDLRIRAMSTQ